MPIPEDERYDTVVVGGGQSGLAAGYYLQRAGQDFVILDAHLRVGDAWRTRWDSLRLFSPNRYNGLPGLPFPGPPGEFPDKDAMADYLGSYAAHFELPVRLGTVVDRVRRADGRYVVFAGASHIEADNVIVATGGFPSPRLPGFASGLDPAIRQLHSSQYRRPSQLRDGPTLLVGAANTGAEIALDIAPTHRSLLSGRDVGQLPGGRFPGRVRGPGLLILRAAWWLIHRRLTTDTRAGRRIRTRMVRGGTPRVRAKRKALDAAGVERVPRTAGVRDGKPLLDDGRVLEVANVVWCTGYILDFGWIGMPAFDGDGLPNHDWGVAADAPGLYFVGLPFQYTLTSGVVGGVDRDAAHVVGHLAGQLRPRPRTGRGEERTRGEETGSGLHDGGEPQPPLYSR